MSSCTAYMTMFFNPTFLQHHPLCSKCLQNIKSGGEMEQENRGKSKQQMNRSQFEMGKSPFNPSLLLHFLLLSSSLYTGSSPLGERPEWKHWAESRSEARSAAKTLRNGSTCPPTLLLMQNPRSFQTFLQ